MKKRILFALVFSMLLVFFNSCTSRQANSNIIISNDKKHVPTCDSTTLVRLINEGKSSDINKTFKDLIHNNEDSCVLVLMDLVSEAYINKPSSTTFINLNELACSFDGYITEYFVDIFPEIYKSNSAIFFEHLYEFWKANKNSTCFLDFVRLYISAYDVDKEVSKTYFKFWREKDNSERNSFYQDLFKK